MVSVSLYMLFSHYLLLRGLGIGSGSSKAVYTGLMFYAQVVLTELSLGIAGQLYRGNLIAVNLVVSTMIFILTWMRHKHGVTDIRASIRNAASALKAIMCWENAVILILTLIVIIWMVAAGYFLPPRGIDDMFYHLPPVYESILQNKLVTLTINEGSVMYPFLFPFNAELLFMWVAIFQHSQWWVDIVQFLAAIYAVIVIYALGRELGLNRRTAYFSASLFLFVPVVMAQSGTTYIDMITNACYLAALLGMFKYAREGDARHLYLAGVAFGLMTGMKYNMLVLALELQLFIVLRPKAARLKLSEFSLYILLWVVMSIYWYARNFILFGSPLYPFDTYLKSDSIMAGTGIGFFRDLAFKARLLFIDDIGLGSLHGGYGILYWGAAFPSWIYCLWKSFTTKETPRRIQFFWIQGLIGLMLLFTIPYNGFVFVPRYSMFVTAIGFLALGKVITMFQENKYKLLVLKSMALGFSLLAVVYLSHSVCPIFDIEKAAADFIKGDTRSQYKNLAVARWDLPSLAAAWDALDYLTKDNINPLNCYVATYRAVLWLSPVYGTNLQNRVWNLLEQDAPARPDAFIYHFKHAEQTLYIKKKIPFEDIASNPEYMLINQTSDTALFIRKDYFTQDNNKLLMSYYMRAYPASVEMARSIMPVFEPGIPIITIPYFGAGLVWLQLGGSLNNDVHAVSLGFEDRYVRHTNWPVVYTFINPLSGYKTQKVADVATAEGPVPVYKNTRETNQ